MRISPNRQTMVMIWRARCPRTQADKHIPRNCSATPTKNASPVPKKIMSDAIIGFFRNTPKSDTYEDAPTVHPKKNQPIDDQQRCAANERLVGGTENLKHSASQMFLE